MFLQTLSVYIQEQNVEIRIPQPLPVVYCNQARVGEIFSNLITNGIKYNDKKHKWVEIGVLEKIPRVLYVRDNGIGIQEKNFDIVFRIL